MKPVIDAAMGIARFRVSRRFYKTQLLSTLAADYSGQAAVTFALEERHIVVRVQALRPVGSEELWQLAGDFANEWLNRQRRLQRLRRARPEAALIVARAFSSALAPRKRAV